MNGNLFKKTNFLLKSSFWNQWEGKKSTSILDITQMLVSWMVSIPVWKVGLFKNYSQCSYRVYYVLSTLYILIQSVLQKSQWGSYLLCSPFIGGKEWGREVKVLPSSHQWVSGGAGIWTQMVWLLTDRQRCPRRASCMDWLWLHSLTVTCNNMMMFQRIFFLQTKLIEF